MVGLQAQNCRESCRGFDIIWAHYSLSPPPSLLVGSGMLNVQFLQQRLLQ